MSKRRELEYSPQAAKQIRNLDKHIKDRVGRSLRRLAYQPDLGKPLKGKENLWSYRFGTPGGEYRAVYRIKPEAILIILVGSRESVYEILKRGDC